MEEVVRSRDATREAVRDIEPERLHARITDRLAETSMAPGALTLRCARAVDGSVDLDAIAERAAGVQLNYDGLRLTRELVHDEPWESDADPADADLDVLVADVLVARGFTLLSRTAAADKAVETVRSFGRDQTLRQGAEGDDAARLDRALEVNVLQLAIVAGSTAAGGDVTPELLEQAASIARDSETPFPPAADVLPEPSQFDVTVGTDARSDGTVHRSATDP